jgi:ABC-type nickel/cobalt efflux system permease component RcnA
LALGVFGVPRGRIIEVYGQEALLTPRGQSFYVSLDGTAPTPVSTTSSSQSQSAAAGWLTRQLVATFESSLILTLFIVFALGMLHTFEGGHSKLILVSLLGQKKLSLKQAVGYAVVFTLSHLGDILIIGTALLLFNQYSNLYDRLSLFERFSVYALLIVAGYLTLKNLADLVRGPLLHAIQHRFGHAHSHDHDHEHHHDHDHTHEHGESAHQRQGQCLAEVALLNCLQFIVGVPVFAVLIKGSQGMRMERAVEVLLKDPKKKKNLLVRQEKEWLEKY